MGILSFFEEFYRLDTELFDKKNSRFIYLFILSFAIFSFNLVPVNAILTIILFLFVIAPLRACFFMFVFYTLWEYVAVFSNGITLNLLFHLILFAKILFFNNGLKIGIRHQLAPICIFWLFYTFVYALFCKLVNNSFTGFNIFFKSLFFIYALSYMNNNDNCNSFWKTVFQMIAISTILTVIYGYFYDTALERWITGLDDNYGSQLYGTLGTTRTGIFTVASIIYSLYYIKNKYLKVSILVVFTVLTFMTISITALGLMLAVFFIYFIYKRYFNGWKLISSITIVIFVSLFVFPYVSHIESIKPMFLRLQNISEHIKYGDIDKAVSGRDNLAIFYINEFEKGSNIEQLLGKFSTSALNSIETATMNSHNSYIDMLFYFGIIGVILTLFISVRKIYFFRDFDCYYPVLSLKFVFLLVATSVSIFSSAYWIYFTLL